VIFSESRDMFSGLQVTRNTMQYKCTNDGVATQNYAVVHCDIKS